jgi:hypothetical protein
MVRSLWAVLAGFIFIGVLANGSAAITRAISPWAFDPRGATMNTSILLVMLAYSSVYGVVGCYLTARLAPSRPMRHALILGLLGVIIACVNAAAMWGRVPSWFAVVNVLAMIPLAWLGGRLRENELAARATTPSTLTV